MENEDIKMSHDRQIIIKMMHDALYDAVVELTWEPYLPNYDGNYIDLLFADFEKIVNEFIEKYTKYIKDQNFLDKGVGMYDELGDWKQSVPDATLNRMAYIQQTLFTLTMRVYDLTHDMRSMCQSKNKFMIKHEELASLRNIHSLLRKLGSIVLIEISPHVAWEWLCDEDSWIYGNDTGFSNIEVVLHRLGIIESWLYDLKNMDPEEIQIENSLIKSLYDK